jgi:hypothetical protein
MPRNYYPDGPYAADEAWCDFCEAPARIWEHSVLGEFHLCDATESELERLIALVEEVVRLMSESRDSLAGRTSAPGARPVARPES